MAAINGQLEALNTLHVLGANLNAIDLRGQTPAHLAAATNQIEALSKLHALGVNLNATDHNGQTPAHFAAKNGQVKALTKLHELGVNLNATDHNGRTPAHDAAKNGHVEALIKLYELGVHLNVADHDGKTPAHYVVDYYDRYKRNNPNQTEHYKKIKNHMLAIISLHTQLTHIKQKAHTLENTHLQVSQALIQLHKAIEEAWQQLQTNLSQHRSDNTKNDYQKDIVEFCEKSYEAIQTARNNHAIKNNIDIEQILKNVAACIAGLVVIYLAFVIYQKYSTGRWLLCHTLFHKIDRLSHAAKAIASTQQNDVASIRIDDREINVQQVINRLSS